MSRALKRITLPCVNNLTEHFNFELTNQGKSNDIK